MSDAIHWPQTLTDYAQRVFETEKEYFEFMQLPEEHKKIVLVQEVLNETENTPAKEDFSKLPEIIEIRQKMIN